MTASNLIMLSIFSGLISSGSRNNIDCVIELLLFQEPEQPEAKKSNGVDGRGGVTAGANKICHPLALYFQLPNPLPFFLPTLQNNRG